MLTSSWKPPTGAQSAWNQSHRTAKPEWFRWLAQMRDALGDKFITGVALYAGNDVLPFGDRLLAAPITALWEL